MHKNNNGFVSGAVLFLPSIKKLREHVEYEKFLCRVLTDDERTKTFKRKTEKLNNRIYAFRYNNERALKLTVAGKTNASQSKTS